ncbi:MAG: exonuclease, partial [Lachnospiraceae bacterium]|nr:exonuclease [Lachnospiraceae bacterium]
SVTITTLASTSSLLLCIPVISGTLKYFFENYRDYYYLPMEDCAMHKSIAQFVSKEYRKRATRETCYQKKQGDFLPQPEKIITPAFCIHAKDSFTFFENTKDALANPSTLKNWAVALLKWLLS